MYYLWLLVTLRRAGGESATGFDTIWSRDSDRCTPGVFIIHIGAERVTVGRHLINQNAPALVMVPLSLVVSVCLSVSRVCSRCASTDCNH